MTPIAPNTPLIDLVALNSYNYYLINLTALRATVHFSNATVLEIRSTVVNGDVLVFGSGVVPMPRFEDVFREGSDVRVMWDGVMTYTIGEGSDEDCIYLSVLGEAESLYYLQYSLNTSANIPQRYLTIIDNTQNDYTLNSTSPYILLKYSSHIIPFTLKFQPAPDCIASGTELPFPQDCLAEVPTTYHSKVVYFNVSQRFVSGQDMFRFTVYANSGEYLLEEDRPVVIGCLDECYETVSVVIKGEQAKIVHSGSGTIR